MKFEYVTKYLPIEKLANNPNSSGPISICGYGSIFCDLDVQGDVIKRGAFKKSIEEHKKNNTMPAMLWQHQNNAECGVWDDVYEDKYGLKLEGTVDPSYKFGSVAVNKISNGLVSGLSIGFYIVDCHLKNRIRYIENVNLIEISLVMNPASPHSRFFPTNIDVDYSGHNVRA